MSSSSSSSSSFAPVFAFMFVFVLACTKPAAPTVVDAGAIAATTSGPSAAEGKALVATACLACHSEEMLAQQRLTKEKWAAEVKKMTTWGAEPSDPDALVSYLAANYGPDAGAWTSPSIAASDAKKALDPQDDGAFASGDVASGTKLFADRCASCHGANARGGSGINLVERPVLYRAEYVATTVRKGRGKMAPLPMTTDREIADLLAHLRTLRVP